MIEDLVAGQEKDTHNKVQVTKSEEILQLRGKLEQVNNNCQT